MARSYQQRERRRNCRFCAHPSQFVLDYKNLRLMRDFVDDRGHIRKASKTGTCRLHQEQIAQQIKRAREIALLPYSVD